MNFEYDFAMLGAKKISSKINYRSEQKCNSKNMFSLILCIACITQELRKIQKWQKSKTLWGYNVSPSWHFLYKLEKDGSPKNISSRTYYAPATFLPNRCTKTIISVQRFRHVTDSLNKKVICLIWGFGILVVTSFVEF